jgi:CRP-like cAMP-binding protein
MQARRVGAGTILVRKGDVADRLFYLVEGELEIEELNKIITAGAVIGEIGVFASDQRRMATVKCKTDFASMK